MKVFLVAIVSLMGIQQASADVGCVLNKNQFNWQSRSNCISAFYLPCHAMGCMTPLNTKLYDATIAQLGCNTGDAAKDDQCISQKFDPVLEASEKHCKEIANSVLNDPAIDIEKLGDKGFNDAWNQKMAAVCK
ncbi:MAG: hypothetical protein JNL01_13485 [Bdellovibrionales bacterium]|nr:hypothetical protein [Bdellovibrionales bacterium]